MQAELSILDNISTGIISLNDSLQVTYINPAAESLLDVSATRVMGCSAGELVGKNQGWEANLRTILTNSVPQTRREIPLQLHSGQTIQVDLSVSITEFNGNKRGIVLEIFPVDRLMRISREENLLMAQESTRSMLRGLAHEIKNPLGGVRGAAQLLARELTDGNLTDYTRVIIREADRLRDLVDRLLGPSGKPRVASLNIHEVLEHVRKLVAAETGHQIKLHRDYDPSLPAVQGDRGLLVQAVLNIARNAVQALQEANTAEPQISFRSRSQRQFTIGTTCHRLVCRLDITDNGPGIPADALPTVFMPMVSGRAGGTGLGLSIAQSILNRHGGLMECQSTPGATVFTLYLPMELS